MKRFFLFLFLCFGVYLLNAHPPAKMTFSYDAKSSLLTVVVEHFLKNSPVKELNKHFISEVVVKVNGKKVLLQNLNDQETSEGETVIYKIRVKTKDKVAVTGQCSLAGSNTAEYVIP